MRLDLLKTVTFAILHFCVGFGVTFALTGSVAIATGVALIEPAVNTVAFFFHERAWQRVLTRKSRRSAAASRAASAAGAWGLPQGAYAKPQN